MMIVMFMLAFGIGAVGTMLILIGVSAYCKLTNKPNPFSPNDTVGNIRYYNIDKFRTIRYYNEKGQYHREDGPAIEYANGDKCWYLNGQLHRIDGPAVEYANGDKFWYINDQRHREDGPAIEYANGDKCWYLNDEQYPGPYTNEEWQSFARKILLLGD